MIPALDPHSATPPFEQIRAQIVAAIRVGDLLPGTRLPTVRALAEDLGVAVNTVARAYRELEQAGVVQTLGRRGTFVEASGEAAERAAFAAAQGYVRRIRELGVDDDGAVRRVLDALRVERD